MESRQGRISYPPTPLRSVGKEIMGKNLASFPSKNALLVKDRINESPGYGLWCMSPKTTPIQFNKERYNKMINEGIQALESDFQTQIERKENDRSTETTSHRFNYKIRTSHGQLSRFSRKGTQSRRNERQFRTYRTIKSK